MGKIAPTQDAKSPHADWEAWVEKKLNYDRWQAQQAADAANAAFLGAKTPTPAKGPQASGTQPAPPGPIPEALLAAVGNPPAFAAPVTPLIHTVTFEDNEAYPYPDHVLMRPRYAFYRFPEGTVSYGVLLKKMPPNELNGLFADAGMTPSEQRIMRAVSVLEGGFETVNTYDTGFVSVGFIQCITWSDGRGSLIEVMQQEKSDAPNAYQRDFRGYGVDITPDGTITAVDPATGAELVGADAVLKIISDKRLTAVFQRAGRHSRAFRVAQVKVAKSHYWPAGDSFTIQVNGQPVSGRVTDVIKSEAGMATLYDRKVNRGNISPFAEVLARIMTEKQIATLAEAAAYERDIVAALKYRTDFLADASLSQPPAPPAPPAPSANPFETLEEMETEEEATPEGAVAPIALTTLATLLCQVRISRRRAKR
jgi:hypothetical protein